MASVMSSTAREHVGFGHLDVWGLAGYTRHREQGDKDYYNYHYYNHSRFFLQSTKMVAKIGSPRSALNSSLSLSLHSEHLLQLGFSSPLCSMKNVILVGYGWDANHIGSTLFQLQCQVLKKCSTLKESSTAPIETGLGPNNRSVENNALITEKQSSNTTPLRKRRASKRSLIAQEQEKERNYALNGSVKFIDKYENLKIVQLVEGMNISGAAYAKCLECASYTTDSNVNSVINILSRSGLNKDETGLVFSKLPSLLKRDPGQLMKVFHLLQGLGCCEEHLCSVCIQYPALLESDSDQIHKVVVFLQSVGLTKEELLNVLHKRPQVLSYPEDRVKLSVNCLLEIGVPKKDLCRVLKKVPKLFSPVIQKNLQIRLEFLVRIGLETRALGKAIARWPSMLGFSLEDMTCSYKYIGQFLTGDDFAKIVTRFAAVLLIDRKRNIEPIIDYLLRLGVKPEDLRKVLLRAPTLLAYKVTTLQAKIKYLRELGVKEEALGKVITRAPQVICLNYEEKLKPVVEFLQSAGLDQDKDIEMVLSRHAQILCFNIEKNLRPKFEFFYTVGLSKRQVAHIAVLFPPMFGLSIEGSLLPKYNYLVNVMKCSVEEIVDFPQYFSYSLEKRIKPRYEQLERRGIHVSPLSMLRLIDKDFESRYLHGKNHELPDNHSKQC